MARILVLQHSPYEPLGMIIHTLKKMKMRIRFVNFYRDPHQRVNIERYHGLVVLGGVMNPDQLDHHPHLVHEIEVIQSAIEKDIPVLGICLGSQLLNIAIGGTCYALDKPEFGWKSVNRCGEHPLFEPFKDAPKIFQWHQYANQTTDDTKIILKNDQCTQAFCYQDKHIGLQFHLEVDAHLMRRWLEHPDYLEHLKTHIDHHEVGEIREQTKEHLERSISIASDFFANYCALFRA